MIIGTRRIISFVPIFQSSILFTSILSRNITPCVVDSMSYNQILLIRFFEMENLLLKMTIIRYNHELFIYIYIFT